MMTDALITQEASSRTEQVPCTALIDNVRFASIQILTQSSYKSTAVPIDTEVQP